MSSARLPKSSSLPRLGFVGVGWIGQHRMNKLLAAGAGHASALVEPNDEARAAAQKEAPDAVVCASLDEALARGLDGIVIATPSAMHASTALRVLEHGVPVFVQKPLGRSAHEARAVIERARARNLLLGVDLSYRHVSGIEAMQRLVTSGALGRVFAVELTFHNAYGPDKPWFYDVSLAGGGCLVDLGTHLVDLALFVLGRTEARDVRGTCMVGGRCLRPNEREVEDYARAHFLCGDTEVGLSCSWKLHAGRACVITAAFYGTNGAVVLENVDGSYYDFSIRHHIGTTSRVLAAPPDDWGGRAIVAWARRLQSDPSFDAGVEQVAEVARILDQIYGRP